MLHVFEEETIASFRLRSTFKVIVSLMKMQNYHYVQVYAWETVSLIFSKIFQYVTYKQNNYMRNNVQETTTIQKAQWIFFLTMLFFVMHKPAITQTKHTLYEEIQPQERERPFYFNKEAAWKNLKVDSTDTIGFPGVWKEIHKVSENKGSHIDIAVQESNYIHITMMLHPYYPYTSYNRLPYTRSTNGGATYENVRDLLSFDTVKFKRSMPRPKIFANDKYVYIFFTGITPSGFSRIWMLRSSNHGETFEYPREISKDSSGFIESIALSGDTIMILAYFAKSYKKNLN
jgi:hypothetical protein